MVLNSSEDTVPATGSWDNEGSECNYTEAWEWVYSIQPAYMGVICVLGMAANSFVLAVLCLQRERSTVADIYLANLTLSDLLMVSCLPFWVVTVTQEFHWSFGEALCKLAGFAIAVNYYCSILFVMMISVDRFLAVVRPLSYIRLRDVSWARVLCLAVWIVGGLLSIPALLFRTVKLFPELRVEACYLDYPHDGWRIRYNVTVNIIGFLVPLIVVSFCSCCIVKALKNNEVQKSSRVKAERKARNLALMVIVVFVLCWLPYQVVMFLDTLYYYFIISGCHWAHGLDISIQLATYLGYANSSLNAFLYAIVGKHFRQKAVKIFKLLLNQKYQSEPLKIIKFTSMNKCNEPSNLGDSKLYLSSLKSFN
ncbi:hypothetical protein GJAV_G00010680 [Gymnothorax javanicus]|nr:hypothetical protein GJAV_G00010680 [Gymnothorax javanicus]